MKRVPKSRVAGSLTRKPHARPGNGWRAGAVSRWAVLLLLCLPLAGWAGDVPFRIAKLSAPPSVSADTAPVVSAAPARGATRALLAAPARQVNWHAVRLAHDWQGASPPLLVVSGDFGAMVWAYLPPDYRLRRDRITDAAPNSTYSHRAVVFELPPDLRAATPIYVGVGKPGQGQRLQLRISDEASYRVADLAYLRVNTFFASVQLSMVLVIMCF